MGRLKERDDFDRNQHDQHQQRNIGREDPEEPDSIPRNADDNHHQENKDRQGKSHDDMAGDREGPDSGKQSQRHHSIQICKQHKKEQCKNEGKEFQTVGSACRPDHVGDEHVAHFGDRLHSGRHDPPRRSTKRQQKCGRPCDNAHPESRIGERHVISKQVQRRPDPRHLKLFHWTGH